MRYESPHWDEILGVCTKHHLPQVPCPQCMAEQDPDVTVHLSETDKDAIAFGEMVLDDFFSGDESDWLRNRVE